MGCCNGHERSDEEEFVNSFFDSLPIRNENSDDVANFIADTLSSKAKEGRLEEDKKAEVDSSLITVIQEKYFKSKIQEFEHITLLEDYYNYNPSKYLLWGILLLCKYNLVKFKISSVIILEALDEPSNYVFGKEYLTSVEYIFALLKPLVDMVSRFVLILLDLQCPKKLENLKRSLEKPFSITIQNEVINKFVNVEEEGKVNFIEFIKDIDAVIDCSLRDNLVDAFNNRPPSGDKELGNEGDVRVKETKQQKAIDKENKAKRLEARKNLKVNEPELKEEFEKENNSSKHQDNDKEETGAAKQL